MRLMVVDMAVMLGIMMICSRDDELKRVVDGGSFVWAIRGLRVRQAG